MRTSQDGRNSNSNSNSGVSATPVPGVGGLRVRAVAGGLSVTPRTPVRRWTHEEASAVNVGIGTRSVSRGGGMGAGRGAAVAGAIGVVPPGYTYGMVSVCL